jgi:hypothetical protein
MSRGFKVEFVYWVKGLVQPSDLDSAVVRVRLGREQTMSVLVVEHRLVGLGSLVVGSTGVPAFDGDAVAPVAADFAVVGPDLVVHHEASIAKCQ